ncbi:hypothetical protein ACP4OV_030116 [Aristida adscensionis]
MRPAAGGAAGEAEARRRGYRGVRRRRWGKWVSEIRVPGSRERLWLGSYATPEAAAVAHDTAVYFLRAGGDVAAALNFPERAAAAYGGGAGAGAGGLSPRSVQRVASDAGMAADAQLVAAREATPAPVATRPDREGIGVANAQGSGSGRPHDHDAYGNSHSRSSFVTSASRDPDHLASAEFSVDDLEMMM